MELEIENAAPALPAEQATPEPLMFEEVERSVMEKTLSAARHTSRPLTSAANRTQRFFKRFSPCRTDVLAAHHVYEGEPVIKVGSTLVPKVESKEDLVLDALFEMHGLDRRNHIPTISINHDRGDRDREEFFEPTKEQIDRWLIRYTTIENGKRVFKSTEIPRFQKKRDKRALSKKNAPEGAEHVTGGNSEKASITAGIREGEKFLDAPGRPEIGEYEGIDAEVSEGVYQDSPEELASGAHQDSSEPKLASSLYHYIQREANPENPITTEKEFGVPATEEFKDYLVEKTEKEIRPRVELERIQSLMDLWDLQVLYRASEKNEEPFNTEAELRKAMTLKKDKYYPPEIARSHVIETTTRSFMTKQPKRPKGPQPEVINIIEHSAQTSWDLWRRAINNTFKEINGGVDGMYILLRRDRQLIRAYLLNPLDEAFEALTYSDGGYIVGSGYIRFLIRRLAEKLGLSASAFRDGGRNIRFLTFNGDSVLVHDYSEFLDDERPLKRGQLKFNSTNSIA
jgi:hypothetical protein